MDKYKQYESLVRDYVKGHINQMLKEPRSFIRYPFIDPGSVYDGNVWDWDTYWSVYAVFSLLDEFAPELQEKILLNSKGNVRNFFDHQLEDGYIPMMIEVADWPEPYLNMKHKEGVRMNMHKPFLCQQICLISERIGDYAWAAEYLPQLEKYFERYEADYFYLDKGLYVWCDDIMIGMDNDPATFGRPKDSTANIYLNAFMVMELEAYEKILHKLSDGAEVKHTDRKRQNLIEAIQRECWDSRDGFYYSVDVDIKTRSFDWFHQGLGVFWNTLPIRIRTWSGFLPMLAGFATAEQAQQLRACYQDERVFKSPYGVTTLGKNEPMFNLEATNNPSNWLGAIWLVANYAVFKGMLNYGFIQEAKEICEHSLTLLGEDLLKHGCMHEYYDPYTGEPVMNGGFMNWNVLVLNMVNELERSGVLVG